MSSASDARVLSEIAELKAMLSGGVSTIVSRVSNLEQAVVDHIRESGRFQIAVRADVSKLAERVTFIERRLMIGEAAPQKGTGDSG